MDNTPVRANEESEDEPIREDVLEYLEKNRATINEIWQEVAPNYKREYVRFVVRNLYREGEITETPEWEYRRVGHSPEARDGGDSSDRREP